MCVAALSCPIAVADFGDPPKHHGERLTMHKSLAHKSLAHKSLARQKQTLDFGRSAVSRYIQLTTLFRRRIESGQWPVDQQIPTVEALALECGVARATIRQALGVLEDEKLIERYRQGHVRHRQAAQRTLG
jgi:predicted transcriptional regulator